MHYACVGHVPLSGCKSGDVQVDEAVAPQDSIDTGAGRGG